MALRLLKLTKVDPAARLKPNASLAIAQKASKIASGCAVRDECTTGASCPLPRCFRRVLAQILCFSMALNSSLFTGWAGKHSVPRPSIHKMRLATALWAGVVERRSDQSVLGAELLIFHFLTNSH